MLVSGIRFIPARAGNRNDPHDDALFISVHPRPCGEQFKCVKCGDSANGSSPPVRGTAILAEATLKALRFIPARAGNRTASTPQPSPPPVHPRPCGEQIKNAYNHF